MNLRGVRGGTQLCGLRKQDAVTLFCYKFICDIAERLKKNIYHLCQQGAASVQHEGVCKVDLASVHLELHIAQLGVVHHAV